MLLNRIKRLFSNRLKSIVKRCIYFPWRFCLASSISKSCPTIFLEGYQKILIIAPHPDDEALGMGGALFNLLSKGISVTICYITQGEHSFDHEAEEIAEKRRQISDKAIVSLPGNLTLVRWHISDGNVPGEKENGYGKLRDSLSKLIIEEDFDCVFVTSGAEPPSDHSNVGKLIKDICHENPIATHDVFEYYVWTWETPSYMRSVFEHAEQFSCFRLSEAERNAKKTLIKTYFQRDNGVVWSGDISWDFLSFFSYSSYEFFNIILRSDSTNGAPG